MAFIHKEVEYYIGRISNRYTISIPYLKNYFKVLEVKSIDSAHNKAQRLIEDELSRIYKE